MQFSSLLLAAAAFTGLVSAQAKFTNSVFNNVTAGKPFTFTWSENSGPVTINLKNGPPLGLKTVEQITSGQTGKSYTWDVPATLPSDTYAFEIIDSTNKPNYSLQVQLIGGASGTPSGSLTPTGSATGSASTSASTDATASVTTSASTTPGANTTSTQSSTRPTGSSTTGSSTTRSATGSSASTTPTTAPGSTAAGFTSNLALVFLAAGALLFIN